MQNFLPEGFSVLHSEQINIALPVALQPHCPPEKSIAIVRAGTDRSQRCSNREGWRACLVTRPVLREQPPGSDYRLAIALALARDLMRNQLARRSPERLPLPAGFVRAPRRAGVGGAARRGNRSSVNLGKALIDCTGVWQMSFRARSD
jgi:hypothetical protein